MGGKRSDQYQIDHAEAGATDYKSLRDEKIHTHDKEEYAAQQAEMRRDELIPRRGVNPALADLQAARDAARADAAGEDADGSRKQRDDTPAS